MVFFYAKYDYETPGLSGGGVWAYGAKGNTQKTSSSSEYWDSTIRPKRKAAIRNDGASNADQAHAKPRNAANPTTSKKPFTGFATSTVSQEEAQGHIACTLLSLFSILDRFHKMFCGSVKAVIF